MREIKFRAWDGKRWHDKAVLLKLDCQVYKMADIECEEVYVDYRYQPGITGLPHIGTELSEPLRDPELRQQRMNT